MINRLNGVTLWSSDLNNLLPFYRDLIGLKVGLESPRFVILGERGKEAILCLGSHSEVHGRAREPHRFLVQLASDDIHADCARLKAAGVEFIEEPTPMSDEHWLATLKDPEGNLVQLNYWKS